MFGFFRVAWGSVKIWDKNTYGVLGMALEIERFPQNPIIHSGLDDSLGENINGPSLIRVPPWVVNPLGKYYLYFAHHRGDFIRLAYADDLGGPWNIYRAGVLHVDQTPCRDHIASPDVHVDPTRHQIVMYYHGVYQGNQVTFVAVSENGLTFRTVGGPLGPSYFRVFEHGDFYYVIAKDPGVEGGGVILRSEDGRTAFQEGPHIIPRMRHAALLKRGNTLNVFFSRGGDCPERILVRRIELSDNWTQWSAVDEREVLAPETEYEGVHLPMLPSRFGPAPGPVRQVRDPACFSEDGAVYLLYSCAGESGIAIARILGL